MKNHTILLADNCCKTRSQIVYKLYQEGQYTIREHADAFSLQACYTTLLGRKKKPDLTIVNPLLSLMSGESAVEKILSLDNTARILILDKENYYSEPEAVETDLIRVVSGSPAQIAWADSFHKSLKVLLGGIVQVDL